MRTCSLYITMSGPKFYDVGLINPYGFCIAEIEKLSNSFGPNVWLIDVSLVQVNLYHGN